MVSSTEKRLGFYLHTSWEFEYPFAVRSWARQDFQNFFAFLEALDFNLLMFWPLTEAMPAPLSDADKAELQAMRTLAEDAHEHGLEFWATFCANVTSRPEIAELPFKQRHLYPFRVDVRLDDAKAKAEYLAHRAELIKVLNNADAYVTIDGDPGGYPQAQPCEFLDVLQADRETINKFGTHPKHQKVVPWLWSGWGSDWSTHGAWNEPIKPLTTPILELLKAELQEPFEILPGRSTRENWANGRVNFELAERAELIEKSVLLCYEIIEFEPTPPAVVIQFDDIRRVLKEEAPLLEKARGVMGNAQQPIMTLPNLYFFARVFREPEYSARSDEEVLHDFSAFLGGDESLLIPAWDCLRRDRSTLPDDLPARLRNSQLHSAAAQNIPSGAIRYLEILAAFVEARLGVLRACEISDDNEAKAQGIEALRDWWNVHRYVFSGESGTDFSLGWIHPELSAPLVKRGLI